MEIKFGTIPESATLLLLGLDFLQQALRQGFDSQK
jgi:hypothetical protein